MNLKLPYKKQVIPVYIVCLFVLLTGGFFMYSCNALNDSTHNESGELGILTPKASAGYYLTNTSKPTGGHIGFDSLNVAGLMYLQTDVVTSITQRLTMYERIEVANQMAYQLRTSPRTPRDSIALKNLENTLIDIQVDYPNENGQ